MDKAAWAHAALRELVASMSAQLHQLRLNNYL